MSTDKRATTVSEAAYNHLLAFTQPVEAWPAEFAERLPTFSELYLAPPAAGKRPPPVTVLLERLRRSPGHGKYLLTGQRGAGKSWTLQHLGQQLASDFTVVRVSATDSFGTTLADAEASDVLVLLCAALANRVSTWTSLSGAELALHRWVSQFKSMTGLPSVPDRTESFGVEITAFFAKFASRIRSDLATREMVRAVSSDDLLLVANALLDLLGKERPVVVLFDDLDKTELVSARRLFGPQFSVLGRIHSKMVLTLPFSVKFENIVTVQTEVLQNIRVKESTTASTVRPEALTLFTELLSRLIQVELVDGMAVEMAVAKSGGITREFGRLLARAFEIAALSGDEHVDVGHMEDAIRDLRVELERATSDSARRGSLTSVRQTKKLDTELDRGLLNENMVVEYVNGHPWYDVHPLLEEVVDSWLSLHP